MHEPRPMTTSGLLLLEMAAPPRAVAVLGRMVGVTLLLVFLFLFAPWRQVAPGSGRVVAFAAAQRQQVVEAPVDGRVVHVWVREGDVVQEGSPLLEIRDVDPELMERLVMERMAVQQRESAVRSRVESDRARVGDLQRMLQAATMAAQARVNMAQERLTATTHALDASLAAQEAAALHVQRQTALLKDGLTSRRTVEVAEMENSRAGSEVERSNAAVRAAQQELASFQADATRVEQDAKAAINSAGASLGSAKAELAAVAAELARLEVRVSRQESQRVVAHQPGQVLRINAGQGGELVKAGDPLLVLVPLTQDRAVELWVDGLHAPLLAVGRPVRIQFDGWPAAQFSGWPNLAVGTFGGLVSFVDAAADEKGRFRVVVTPDPQDASWPDAQQLRQGVRVNAWVLLNEVTVGFELWRQINGFPPSPTPVAPPAKASGGK